MEIGKRLAGYDRSMDRLVATVEAVETASTAAGIVLGAGVVATAVKTGGKWAIVKTAIAVGTGYALDKAIDKGLETAGASPQTIRGLRLAAAVFMLILIRRRGRAAPVESDVSAARRGETSEAKESNALSPDSSKSSTGPRINEAGDHAKGDRARPQETEPSTASGPTDPASKNPRVRNGGGSSAAAGSLEPVVASENLQSLIASERRYWVRSVQFKGVKVYQRDDLIDPKLKASGVTNIDRMRRSNAPIGPDQKPLNLHHLLQMEDGAVAEMTETFHNGYRRTLHINPPAIPSGIERQQFASYRVAYWKMRALDFEETRP